MTETLAHMYSSDSTQRELSIQTRQAIVLRMKVALALVNVLSNRIHSGEETLQNLKVFTIVDNIFGTKLGL